MFVSVCYFGFEFNSIRLGTIFIEVDLLEANGTQVFGAVVFTAWLLGVLCGSCCCRRQARVSRNNDGLPAWLLARLEPGVLPGGVYAQRLPSGESFGVPRTLGKRRPGRE